MSWTWETRVEDVMDVLDAHDIRLPEERLRAVFYQLDKVRIERAAMAHEDMDSATEAAYWEIARQLEKNFNLLVRSGPKEWSPRRGRRR